MIKQGDVVRIARRLTVQDAGTFMLKCTYTRPATGETRFVEIPVEIAEVVKKEGPADEMVQAQKEAEKSATSITLPEHKCKVCGKVCKASIGLSGHMRSHASKR